MELTQLRYVVAVADTGNFTRAAKAAQVAQPSLSQQINKLESELGHRLFHRMGRRAVPTEAGDLFIHRARRILFEVDNMSLEIRDNPEVLRTINVGAIQTFAPYVLPPLIDQARRDLPNLSIHTQEAFQSDLLQAVNRGTLDLALVMLPVNGPQLAVESLFSESLVVAMGRDHPLAQQAKLTLADIAKEPLVILGKGSALGNRVQRVFGDKNYTPRIAHTCAQMETLKDLVARGLGISVLPQLAQNPTDADRLIYRKLADAKPTREIGIVRHFQRYQTTGTNQFLDLLRTAANGFI